ncbi:hypothetical protein PINS_up009849 [Pythium insidiosum]|nr:hypothetical protein PINS_up009849 [Pythium insidiosum]
MQDSGGDGDEGRVSTPVAEYQLAASPRSRPLGDDEASTSTFRLDGFTLKSPFARRSPTAVAQESKSEEDADVNELVDTFVESPTKRKKDAERAKNDGVDGDDDDDDVDGDEDDKEEESSRKDGGDCGKKAGDDGDMADEYRYVHVMNDDANAPYNYVCNTVITSRFTIYNFIPKLLFYEFSKLANAYFLIISIMQTIKPISNTGGFPASLPALSIIVLIDMFFACLEDYKRHKADHIANQLPCRKYNRQTKSFEPSKWQLLHVGDVVKVHNREPVPADLVILGVCEPEPENPAGICYVETKSLDGETNLKLRQGLEATYTILRSDECIAGLEGVVVCELPNNAIHRFNGTLTLQSPNKKKEVITANAVCLRGSTLRNTEYIYGLVVNTGPDTKIMMASSDAPIKWSDMETRLNKQITYICGLMIVLCLTGAIASTIWNSMNLSKEPNQAAWYLYDPGAPAIKAPAGYFVIQLLYYFLLLNSFIPVSLYVSMTSVKFMQSYFMNNDKEMYHDESDTPCQVRTMSLNEELGQIDYIFSDKTGTLTCNIMEFRKCSIQGVSYGIGETEIGIAARKRRLAEECDARTVGVAPPILEESEDEATGKSQRSHRIIRAPFVNYQDDTIFDALNRQDAHAAQIRAFFEHLAVCHTVMPEKAPDGTVRLSASSPDEQALVAAAACFGYKFAARAPGKAILEYIKPGQVDSPTAVSAPIGSDPNRPVGDYQVLEVLEFNSTRKRMSVITRGPDGQLKLLCKGADTVMYERLRQTNDPNIMQMRNLTLQQMETFASEGLRTLVIASADVDPEFYEGWVERYRTAINDMRQIELRRLGEVNDIDRCMEEIEVNMEILGATAIEDRLQNGVPDTIHKLRQATIKIWMLTGDKEETAINIGFACRLLTADMERIVISADTHPDLDSIVDELERYRDFTGSSEPPNSSDVPLLKGGVLSGNNPMVSTPPGLETSGRGTGATTSMATGTIASSDDASEERRQLTRIESVAAMDAMNPDGLALVIDGETLEVALAECPLLLLSVAQQCNAVIACRVSPAQKAELVRLVRENNPEVRTLAIGDGANDVSMIQCAHVGVGISGQEGMQAANSSDYAIAQFRFLARLLLVHGRWNYIRMGKLILYIFYKNVMMNLTQFWYMIFTGFSGQKFFLEWGLQGYNLLFTALPIVLVSTFEQDVPAKYAQNYPVLYRVGQENSHFNTKIVWGWISSCVWESIVISLGTIYGMKYLLDSGETPTMWVYGCVAFTIVVLVVTLKLCLHQQMWWAWPPTHIIVYMVSFSLWIATAALISFGHSVSSAYWNGVFTNVFGTKAFWLLVPLLTFTALSRDLMWKGYIRAFRPSYKHLAQEVHAFGLERLADKLLSFPPPESIPREERRDLEAAEVVKDIKPALVPAKKEPSWRFRGPRKSITRGSAFSYDAESVMVESFMASERYNRDPQTARPIFERHASRGSMAFHTFVGSTSHLHGTFVGIPPSSSSPREHPTSRNERQASAGNVFRGARHSYGGRRRFFSVATMGPGSGSSGATGPAGTPPHSNGPVDLDSNHRDEDLRGSFFNRMLRRTQRALSSDAVSSQHEHFRASSCHWHGWFPRSSQPRRSSVVSLGATLHAQPISPESPDVKLINRSDSSRKCILTIVLVNLMHRLAALLLIPWPQQTRHERLTHNLLLLLRRALLGALRLGASTAASTTASASATTAATSTSAAAAAAVAANADATASHAGPRARRTTATAASAGATTAVAAAPTAAPTAAEAPTPAAASTAEASTTTTSASSERRAASSTAPTTATEWRPRA